MLKNTLALTLLIILSLTGLGAAATDQAKKTALIIDGDDLIVDTKTENVIFTGNVIAIYGEYQIKAQKLVYEQKTGFLKIDGAVELIGQKLKASAKTMEFDLGKELLTMTGDVEVLRDGQIIRGTTVFYDVKSEFLRVKKAHLEIGEIKNEVKK